MTGYCTALNAALLSRSLRVDVETQLRWLLHDMVNLLVRYLKQPCIKGQTVDNILFTPFIADRNFTIWFTVLYF